MTQISIGDLARRFGLNTSALRYYQEAGLLLPVTRVGGQRRYDESSVRRLSVIRLAQSVGFTLAEIRTLLEERPDWRPLTRAKVDELGQQIKRLRAMQRLLSKALECDCVDVEACGRLASRAMPTAT